MIAARLIKKQIMRMIMKRWIMRLRAMILLQILDRIIEEEMIIFFGKKGIKVWEMMFGIRPTYRNDRNQGNSIISWLHFNSYYIGHR